MAQLLDVPAWGTEQNPEKLGPNPPELRELCRKTLAKMHFGAVSDGLGDWLRPPARPPSGGGNARSLPKHLQKPAAAPAAERQIVVVAGCEAHVCLMQTALELIEQEFDVWVATATRLLTVSQGRVPNWSPPKWWPSNGCAVLTIRCFARCTRSSNKAGRACAG
jgi:hypothetical protein